MRTYARPSVLEESGSGTILASKQNPYMLCTKSPNKFRYADNFDGPRTPLAPSFDEFGDALPFFSEFLDRTPFCEMEVSLPVVLTATDSIWACVCVWPVDSSSPPSTRRVFSIKKKDAKPMNIASLYHQLAKYHLHGHYVPDDDISLFLNHYEMNSAAHLLAHEGMGNEVQKNIG